MPSIFQNVIDPSQAFTSPIAYQTFIFHTMIVVTGFYIAFCDEIDFKLKHYLSSILTIIVFGILSLYINSIFSVPVYENGVLKSIESSTNFFFTYKPPIDIKLTSIHQWHLYLIILTAVAITCISVCYIPYLINKKKKSE